MISWYDVTPEPVYHDEDGTPMHGTESRYVHHNCRCDYCRRAANARRRIRRKLAKWRAGDRSVETVDRPDGLRTDQEA